MKAKEVVETVLEKEPEEEITEPEEEKAVEVPEEKPVKKRRKLGYSLVFVIICILAHIGYTVFVYTRDVHHGIIWTFVCIAELAVLALILKARKKVYYISRFLAFLMAIVFVFAIVADGFLMMKGNDNDFGNADYVLVFGTKLTANQMSDNLKYRLDKTVEYMQAYPNCKVVLCGGLTRGNTETQANVMSSYLQKMGINANRIQLLEASTDLYENVANCKSIIYGNNKVVVISNTFNVYRLKEICRLQGVAVRGIGTKWNWEMLIDELLQEKIGLLKLLVS